MIALLLLDCLSLVYVGRIYIPLPPTLLVSVIPFISVLTIASVSTIGNPLGCEVVHVWGDDHLAWKRRRLFGGVQRVAIPPEGMIASARDILKSTLIHLEPLDLVGSDLCSLSDIPLRVRVEEVYFQDQDFLLSVWGIVSWIRVEGRLVRGFRYTRYGSAGRHGRSVHGPPWLLSRRLWLAQAGDRCASGNHHMYYTGILRSLPPVVAQAVVADDTHNARMDRIEQCMRQMRSVRWIKSFWDDFGGMPVASLPAKFRMPDIESGAAQRWFASLESSRRRTWDDLAQEFLRQFSFNTVVDVSRRELEAPEAEDRGVSFFFHFPLAREDS
ncbi:hypothetical protein CK203_103507 [Vitis vinifera]|uniref:Retrotransposon gag domain-containing protein n=1 Tax=Vitis vinifera TaxID=29760 RepID=A0A438CQN6_VITVI|nr:hypothetical protein CK203_103507 [Vitis vinifera]